VAAHGPIEAQSGAWRKRRGVRAWPRTLQDADVTRPLRLLLRAALVLLVLLLIAVAAGWWALRGSLPRLDGELALPGLSAPASVARDAIGVVTVDAANADDAARALGFVHGQERFFEMDLLRRAAAGELSALFGSVALGRDRDLRVHRLRARVRASFDAVVDADGARQLAAYADGVNAGRDALRTRPWPYLLLRAQPEPWTPEDSLLAGYAMFFDLQDESNSRELALWRIRAVVPPALYALLAHDGSEWDAPLAGRARGNATLPTAAQLDLRKLPAAPKDGEHDDAEPAAPGSNNFAVSGALTADGRAIVADDMHLGLRAPNIWFRARLRYADPLAPGGRVDVSGFTLPGLPGVIVGSNGHVAWGFTNSYGDWHDFVRVRWADAARTRYASPSGEQPLRVIRERIAVKGGEPVELEVRETLWGPVTETLDARESLALRWAAHQPGALNLGLSELTRAGDIDAALRAAAGIGMPAQNLVAGDSRGRIAWRLTGRLPLRRGDCDIAAPLDPARCAWAGWALPADNPVLVDPPSGRLWTANARTVDGATLARIGDAGYANGARAKQIRDALFAAERFDERALLAIQLDDRALFLERWWRLLRAEATRSKDPAWVAIEAATRDWEGRATPRSVSYRIVRAWRLAVLERVKHGLTAPAQARLGKAFAMPDLPQFEGVAWPLVTQRPAHLLPRGTASWNALLADAAREMHAELAAKGPLAARTWGERNTAAICHPLARALGPAKGWLCMPAEPLAGDSAMPRVQSPGFGASERMVVSPGHEADGLVHMPGGQSGHPLSPYWGAGHDAWVHGMPTPFLPGPAETTLSLRATPP
jgi:penicillin amidase